MASRTLWTKENPGISSTNGSTVSPGTSFSPNEHSSSFHQDRPYDLPSLVELSLANNPYTRSAWFNALSAKASVGQAKAPYYPTLKFNATGGYDSGYNPIQTGPETYQRSSINAGFQLEYLLLDFGRRDADVRSTTALLQAANLNFNRRMQTTLFAVQQSYFAHTAALSQQQAAEANLDLSRTILSMVEAQKNSGLATEPELLIARKTLSQAELDLAAANRNAEVTLGNLRIAAGLQANTPLKVSPPRGDYPVEGISGKVDRLIDAAIGSRPDLAAKTADVRASEAATIRAKADFLPKLSLQGTWNKETYGYNAQLAGVNLSLIHI